MYYNRRNGTQVLPDLRPGDVVLQKLDHEKEWSKPATVVSGSMRSYTIATPSGLYRRNRRHLKPTRCFRVPPDPVTVPFQFLPPYPPPSPRSPQSLPPVDLQAAAAPTLPNTPGSPVGKRPPGPVQPPGAAEPPQPSGAPIQTPGPPRSTRCGRAVKMPARYQ